ncbi:hypothetical protein NCCP2716_16720 [Sporosarcina sp. NCCP-2716]|uniref:hypothetical protein n=1 Tax=Sporosarcina sp. NCCP-2716 TaxID=2943679 RepID=UPI00203C31ED|nr:hypothetical protein [Sporosarcina sp. NCCP-2716]GKV69174.1 hypothetical protein NCCP2716_16720 [Sporosarcina sp. NCCP-2716]
MFKSLSPNLKSSITRSITQTFEQYMTEIEWDPERYDMNDFMKRWSEYITKKALWYSKIPDDVKHSAEFHEDVASRINEVIRKVLSEPASEDQIASIEQMQEDLNTEYIYECKAEAAFVEAELKKRMNA